MADQNMNDNFNKWFKGDIHACHFAESLWTACQDWDDLEDEGHCDHNVLLSWLAFGKEYHAFFQGHAEIMRPALLMMYLQWRASNVMDRGDKSDVAKSYMLRAGIYSVWYVMTWIVGGDDWAAKCGPEIYRSYGESPEEIWREFN